VVPAPAPARCSGQQAPPSERGGHYMASNGVRCQRLLGRTVGVWRAMWQTVPTERSLAWRGVQGLLVTRQMYANCDHSEEGS